MLSNDGCKPDRDMAILECCRRREPRNCSNSNHCDSAGVRCRGDQLIKNVSATLIDTPTTGSTLTRHIVLVIWQLQRNSSRTTALPRSFEVRCFNEMHSCIKISVSSTTFTIQVGGLLRSSCYTCCVLAVYELYTAKGVCTRAETPGSELLTTVTESFSTQVETPDLGITKIAVTQVETVNIGSYWCSNYNWNCWCLYGNIKIHECGNFCSTWSCHCLFCSLICFILCCTGLSMVKKGCAHDTYEVRQAIIVHT